MNVLYKYCDKLGAVNIPKSLELKLPYISQVNDPLECLPFFYCPNDKGLIEARYLSILKQRSMPPLVDYERRLDELYETGEIQKTLADSSRKTQKNLNRKSCLLSVSKTARNTVMWAHYAEHEGVVIGIDFDNVFPETGREKGILMEPVNYSEERPQINILTDFNIPPEAYRKTVFTKSVDWSYEKEFRAIFPVDVLEDLQKQRLACFKDFNGNQTWFLKLNPESIREIIFGLYTEDSLKLAIGKLIKQPKLKHIKLYQAEESETYTLDLKEI